MVSRKLDYSGVPSGDLENSNNQRKYTINSGPRGNLVISKPVCALMAIGAILLAVLAALLVFLFLPRCSEGTPQALIKLRENAEKADNIDERLPQSIQPLYYRLQIIPNVFGENLTTNGAVTIILHAAESTNKIVLNSYQLDIDSESLKVINLNDSKQIKVTNQEYNEDEQKYTITLGEYLQQHQQYELQIKFSGIINDKMQGFYKSQYYDSRYNRTTILASTQFSPTDARRAFPCFDEPSFKARFTISVTRPSNVTTLSNMKIRETVVNVERPHWLWDHYEETPIMSTYLVAFVISDLTPFKYNSSGNFFTVWSRPDAIDQTRYAVSTAPALMRFLTDYIGIEYPLAKTDLVAVPDFGYNAMENWGLITFRESRLLFDERYSTVSDKRDIALTMGHEFAHQWFGNLVTPRWWNDLWLKEGFATYLGYLAVNRVESKWKIMEEFPLSVMNEAFKVDALSTARPVSFEVKNSKQIRQSFDAISYSKGASLISMANHFLGEEEFKRGLTNYLNTYKYSNADRNDLWNSLSLYGGRNLPKNVSLADIMDGWVLQPGFPVVTAIVKYPQNKIEISQKRFVLNGPADETYWWVPISITNSSNPLFGNTKPTYWLANTSQALVVDVTLDQWILLNVNQTGYYIVNYDEDNWKALLSSIEALPHNIAAQLIADSMDLARANLLDYNIPLSLTKRAIKEDKYIMKSLFTTAFDRLNYLEDMLYSTSTHQKFRMYILKIFDYAFNGVGFEEKHDYIPQRLQQLILKWSCKDPESYCVSEARSKFLAWASTPERTRLPLNPPSLMEVIYCTAIREGNDREWNVAYRRYLASNLPSEKKVILSSLGCTSKPSLLSKYLEFILRNDSGIRKQDAAQVFEAVAKNPAGYQLAFTFLRNNWSKLRERFGEGFKILSRMVDALPTYMKTTYELKDLQEFKDLNADTLGTAEQALERAIEVVKANIAWMYQSYESVDKWLTDFNHHY